MALCIRRMLADEACDHAIRCLVLSLLDYANSLLIVSSRPTGIAINCNESTKCYGDYTNLPGIKACIPPDRLGYLSRMAVTQQLGMTLLFP